jgi:hypothetical protein
MRFLAISRSTGKVLDQALADDMDAEIANGRRLFEAGFIVQGYMDPTYTTAIFIIEASSEEDAQQQLGTYPQVIAGLSNYDLTPLIGLPAIEQSISAASGTLPTWWPSR